MGITVYTNKGHSFDIGYFGFANLRQQIAELAGIGEHYDNLKKIEIRAYSDPKVYDEYDRITEKFIEDGILDGDIGGFLYSSDSEASLSCKVARKLLSVIGDYDDNIIYGYAGRNNPAMFKDFKQILKDCVKNRTNLRWD